MRIFPVKKEAIEFHWKVPNYNLFINAYVRDRAVVVEVAGKLTKNRVDMLLEQARGNTERRKWEELHDNNDNNTRVKTCRETVAVMGVHFHPLALLFEGVGTAGNELVGGLSGLHLQGGGFLVQLLWGYVDHWKGKQRRKYLLSSSTTGLWHTTPPYAPAMLGERLTGSSSCSPLGIYLRVIS